MRLKINKACDLNSISVFPPPSRRPNTNPSAVDPSALGKSQTSQFGSQLRPQSQQSQSQGISLSQLSQSSFDDVLTNEQRLGPHDQTFKRVSCLGPTTSTRDESQMQITRLSNNAVRRWNSASGSEQRSHVSEEFEHRIGLIDTNMNRLGRMLDSVQGDIMQVHKTVREATLETEGIRQKLMLQDNTLCSLTKGQEDVRASLDRSVKSISEQIKNEFEKNKLHEILPLLSALPNQIDARIRYHQAELCGALFKEMKRTNPVGAHHEKNESIPSQLAPHALDHAKSTTIVNIEKSNPKKQKSFPIIKRQNSSEPKREINLLAEQEHDFRVLIESDEEMDIGFSVLLDEKKKAQASYLSEETKRETMQILRKAQREKRKFNNIIILD